MSNLWIFFIILAVTGAGTFLYAFRNLDRRDDVDKRIADLETEIEADTLEERRGG